jgi:amino acid transporter
VKFIPLAFAAIIGYVVVGTGGVPSSVAHVVVDSNSGPRTFNSLTPFLGIMASIPAIFFAYDGFYTTAGIQTEMKDPKKVSMVMTVGLLIVSAIDILISISLLIPHYSAGTITSLRD